MTAIVTVRWRDRIAAAWTAVLVTLLGACLVLVAAGASSPVTALLGVVGGIAVLIAPWLPVRRRPAVLMLLAPVPFAIATWWTLVVPLVVVLAIVGGWSTVGRRPRLRPQTGPGR